MLTHDIRMDVPGVYVVMKAQEITEPSAIEDSSGTKDLTLGQL
jgi:hypothetical protein